MKIHERVVIGVDIGTTSTKAVVFDEQGRVLASHAIDYPIIQPHPGFAEQDPEELFAAVIQVVGAVIVRYGIHPKQVKAMGLSAAMHSIMALDGSGRPLTRLIIWADNRSVAQAERLLKEQNGLDIYRRTGTPIHPMSPLPKLLWLKEKQPDVFRQARWFVSVKDYVLYRLYGDYIADHSLASATGLFRLDTLDWDEGVLSFLGISREQLPRLVPAIHILQGMKKEWADKMGVSADVPVVIGASDGVLANVGVGAVLPGEAAITIGTSGAVRTIATKPTTDEKGRTFCYALTPGYWVVGGPTNNGGILLRWLRDEFGAQEREVAKKLGMDPYDLLTKYAERVPPGSEGLVFLPFLSGERAPYWNANARGTFFGLGLHHRREHLIRAVMEGVCFSILSVALAIRDATGPMSEIRVSGGFAKSPFWRQMLADMLGKPLIVPQTHEASALGAAAVALHALGELPSLEMVKPWIGTMARHEPNEAHTLIYAELFDLYARLYERLKEEFDVIAAFQRRNG
ncbi:xylulokinase [Geobacillus thermoleovorans]|uniref:xylulokinase n=1 Tax=Geobacillus thermoleovorans TaxID=33941 RepID=UPI0009BE7EF7|nr:xylulokinase [Geobacillus thermoleovorans]MBW7644129.1 xylulokinase [Geobacillus thermoleovorans]OQP11940.1 xylulokinase [Geobacillus thermoleovorans]QNU21679.1 xylulokinase [Geobacillus thermoleovorans]